MEIADALFGGEPPGLSLPRNPRIRAVLSAPEIRKLALEAPLPPPRRKVLEGLSLLWHDHWDDAHAAAQSREDAINASEHESDSLIEGQPDYDLLHAMGHRREGDYPNADYWFRSCGRHPAFERLAAAAGPALAASPLRDVLLPGGAWSCRAFTAEVRRAVKAGDSGDAGGTLLRLQAMETRAFAGWLLQG